MKKSPNTIAVDLTPILPGGENGGAKIFVIELLIRLAEIAPQTQFVLLTQAISHDELSVMDRPNMRRMLAVPGEDQGRIQSHLMVYISRILAYLPGKLNKILNHLIDRLLYVAKCIRAQSKSILREIGADLLFCPFTAPFYYEPGVPTVCIIYDLQYKTYPEFFHKIDAMQRKQTFVDACNKSTFLAAISDYTREAAIMHGNLEKNRIRTIYLRMANRLTAADESDNGLLCRLGLTHQRYFLYPANFWKHKNHEMLITAFSCACHNKLEPDIRLVCTGAPGARRDWLKHACNMMNLDDRIIFPGYLPEKDLSILLTNSLGIIFPSLYEGFGLPIIEAMAAGVPVACSNSTSLPEVSGDAAILFDPRIPEQIANAIITLANDKRLRSQLIDSGKQRAKEFSNVHRMATEYWELFQVALKIT